MGDSVTVKRLSVGLAIAMVLLLAACKRSSLAEGALCFPEAARPWLAGVEAPARRTAPDGPLHLLIDGSGSMVGYLGRGSERPLADLLGMLPTLDGAASEDLRLTRFDRVITQLAPDDLSRFQLPDTYRCLPGRGPCTNQESHIDKALELAAADGTDTVSVIVSDLWLSNDELRTTSAVALSRHLEAILRSGRAIAVYGFESPYAGRVYDMPSGRADVTATRRHIFLVAAGPRSRLEAMHRAMLRAPAEYLASALADGSAGYAIFSQDPVVTAMPATAPFAPRATGSLVSQTFLQAQQGIRIPQYQLDRRAAMRATEPEPGIPWSGIQAEAVVPGAVWRGPMQGETRLFRQARDMCRDGETDWRPEGRLEGGWTPAGGFSLDPAGLATLSNGVYLLVGEVKRVGLDSPNPATDWMRAWSFSDSEEAEAIERAGRGEAMPTLNLAATARLLENALQKVAEERPQLVGGFVAAVKVG
ncbi:MAG: hypothetical protein SNJ79_12820 [Sphingomonadaceae bacterium]